MFKFKWFLKAASRAAFSCKTTTTAHASNSIFHYLTASSPSISASERRALLLRKQSRGSRAGVDIVGMSWRDWQVKRKLLFVDRNEPVDRNEQVEWNDKVEWKSNVDSVEQVDNIKQVNSINQVDNIKQVDSNDQVPLSSSTTNFNPQNNHDLFPFLSQEELKVFDSRIYE